MIDEAYERYGVCANQGGTYLATFRAVARKYPHKAAGEILADLVKTTPGNGGKWFAAAKDAGLYADALSLAKERIRKMVAAEGAGESFVTKVLGRELGL